MADLNGLDGDDGDERTKVARTDLVLTPGKDMVLINEPGLYSLILWSSKPSLPMMTRRVYILWVPLVVARRVRNTYIRSEQENVYRLIIMKSKLSTASSKPLRGV